MMIRLRLVFAVLFAVGFGILADGKPAQAIETAAQHAILIDYDTQTVLFAKNPDEPLHPASMSKLMTVYLVFEKLKKGEIKMDDQFPVSEKAWRMGGSKMFVHVGDRVRLEDLLRGIIVQSGNDACIVVAEGLAGSEQAFAEKMTAKAKELGLEHSTFTNSTGWPDPGHQMTARDLATLAQAIIRDFPEYYHLFSEIDFTYNGIKQGNRNPLLYKNMGVDGLKTGHTDEAGFGLTASALRNGRRLILVVQGLTGVNDRADEAERLIEYGYREFDNYTLAKAGATLENAPVWMGSEASVPITVSKNLIVTLPRSAHKAIKASVILDGPLHAPIQKGQPIGKIVIQAGDMPPFEEKVVAGADVPRSGPIGHIIANLRYLVFGHT